MVHFSEDDVRRLLPMPECIEALRSAFQAYAAGEAQNQPRRRLRLKTGAALHSMAGAYDRYFGTKFYSTSRFGAHFLFALYDAATGEDLALFEANHLGQIRTGAVSGLAVDLLAPSDVTTLAVIGSGFQARSQVDAIRSVRGIQRVRTWSRNEEKRRAFADEIGAEAADTAEQAVRGADIVVTATSSREPVFDASWVGLRAVVCAMGSNDLNRRELPPDLVTHAALVVADDVEQCKLEAGDLVGVDWDSVVGLADIVAGKRRAAADGVTIFKSVGLGLEDVAAAAVVWEKRNG